MIVFPLCPSENPVHISINILRGKKEEFKVHAWFQILMDCHYLGSDLSRKIWHDCEDLQYVHRTTLADNMTAAFITSFKNILLPRVKALLPTNQYHQRER